MGASSFAKYAAARRSISFSISTRRFSPAQPHDLLLFGSGEAVLNAVVDVGLAHPTRTDSGEMSSKSAATSGIVRSLRMTDEHLDQAFELVTEGRELTKALLGPAHRNEA